MKQRLVRFGLILAAALVWGAVARRAFAPSNKSHTSPQAIVPAATNDSLASPPEQITLVRDPFFPTSVGGLRNSPNEPHPQSASRVSHKATAPAQPSPPTSRPLPKVIFKGMMRGPQLTSSVAFLEVADRSVTVRTGDEVIGMRIITITSDSVVVEYDGRRAALRKAN